MPRIGTDKKYVQLKAKLHKKYGEVCWYCGLPLDGKSQHIDHIIPKSRGGSDEEHNRALACSFCNMAKYNYDLSQFLQWLCHIRSGNFNCRILDLLTMEQLRKNLTPSELDQLNKDFGNAFKLPR